jgi:fructokinase
MLSPLDTRTLRRRHVSGNPEGWNDSVVIVICGEAVVDLVPDPSVRTRYDARPGGSGANTAVALARLGTPVTMLARLSGDGFGRLLRHHLLDNAVDVSHAVAAAEPSSVAIATVAADGGADYRFLVNGTADWGWTETDLDSLPSDTAAVHGGSLALALPPGGAAVERMLGRARRDTTVSLDPNIRPGLIADMAAHRDTVERCVAAADLVKVSHEDLDALHPGVSAMDVVRRWARSGPRLVVLTDGELPGGARRRRRHDRRRRHLRRRTPRLVAPGRAAGWPACAAHRHRHRRRAAPCRPGGSDHVQPGRGRPAVP